MMSSPSLLRSAAAFGLIVLCGAAVAAGQTTYYVDDDAPGDPGPGDPTVSDPLEDGTAAHPFDAIQEGINAAVAGDTVLVADGTYSGTGNRNIALLGKAITVISANGAADCVVDCQGAGWGFSLGGGETHASTLDGFTITNGYPAYGDNGGGLYVSSSPTVKNCVVSVNTAPYGGGVFCDYSNAIFMNCRFSGNLASNSGGGVYVISGSPSFVNCEITGNNSSGVGGGVRCVSAQATLTNCTVAYNSATEGGGVFLSGYSGVTVGNGVFYDDTAPLGAELAVGNYSSLTISYSDVAGGLANANVHPTGHLYWGAGMIDADPLFLDTAAHDYHLTGASPCIDAGTNDPPGGLPATDIDGLPRPVDGDGDVEPWTGQAETADMGIDEYLDPNTPYICLSTSAFVFSAAEGGPDPNDQTLSIWNCASGQMNWQIVEDCPWLSADPNAGDSTGEVDDVALSVDVAGLAPGQYVCDLEVVAPGAPDSPQTVQVTLDVAGPEICLSDTQFTFEAPEGGPNPGDQILSISNCGIGQLNWQIVESCSWLNADPNSGDSTGEVDDVALSVDVTGLAVGQYVCDLEVAAPGAANSPQAVQVTLDVVEPEICLSDTQFTFAAPEGGPDPGDQTLSIWNCGAGQLNWQVVESCSWLSADPNAGDSTGEFDDVALSVSVSGLTAGEYNCTCDVVDPAAANNPQTVDVTLYVGRTLHVPSEYATIQAAIDAAYDSETVLVADGRYTGTGNRDLDFGGKAITVTSENGPDSCIIDCENAARAFYFHNGETTASVVSGLRIINGLAVTGGGGGIFCNGASPTISNCHIAQCAGQVGGGIRCYNSEAYIVDCVLTYNYIFGDYGGSAIDFDGGATPTASTIERCTVMYNYEHALAAGQSAAIAKIYPDTGALTARGCVITNNDSYGLLGQTLVVLNTAIVNNGRGVSALYPGNPVDLTITNSIIHSNESDQVGVSDGVTVSYSVVQGGWPGVGNLDLDPQLTHDRRHLLASSPCVDAGDPGFSDPGTDLDGEPRIANGRVDIGPDEFLDDDDDALPNWWELLFYQSPTLADPAADDDGDGLNNEGEYSASRNPLMDSTTYFVDPAGDDAWNGLAPTWDGVNGPKATLQAAIDAAGAYDSDTVVLADGTYAGFGNYNVNWKGKYVDVSSAGGAANCTIDCGQLGRAVYLHGLKDEPVGITGVTIANGRALNTPAHGGGVYCRSSMLNMTGCIISDCNSDEHFVPTPGILRGGGHGGGLYGIGSDITLNGCSFTGDAASASQQTAGGNGGGVAAYDSTVSIVDGSFEQNAAGTGGSHSLQAEQGGSGGAIFADTSDVVVVRVTLLGNQAGQGGVYGTMGLVGGAGGDGGAIAVTQTDLIVAQSLFTGNTAGNGAGANDATDANGGSGGAIHADASSSLNAANCLFSGNTTGSPGRGDSGYAAPGDGGAIYGRGLTQVSDCTFTQNVADPLLFTPGHGGAVAIAAGTASVANSILWNDSPDEILGAPDVRFSNVSGSATGDGNIEADPLFTDPNNGDYHLMAGSPCVDAGDNFSVPPDTVDLDNDGNTVERVPLDLDGEGRFFDDPNTVDAGSGCPPIVDMGAYELGGTGPQPCLGDFDCSGDVDLSDLAKLLANYGVASGASYTDGDLDGDGDVDLSDLALLLSIYGQACP